MSILEFRPNDATFKQNIERLPHCAWLAIVVHCTDRTRCARFVRLQNDKLIVNDEAVPLTLVKKVQLSLEFNQTLPDW
jgi:hypothetical protein